MTFCGIVLSMDEIAEAFVFVFGFYMLFYTCRKSLLLLGCKGLT